MFLARKIISLSIFCSFRGFVASLKFKGTDYGCAAQNPYKELKFLRLLLSGTGFSAETLAVNDGTVMSRRCLHHVVRKQKLLRQSFSVPRKD